jgi:hypothetical protein
MNKIQKVSDSLEETIKNSDLQNVTADLAETFIDSMLNDGILKDIPVLGTIVGLARSTISLKDRLFLRKVMHFLNEISSVPPEEREAMISQVDSSDSFKIKVGEKLLYIVDKCEDHKAASQIAKLFCSFLKGLISYSDFLRGSRIINSIHFEDLELFLKESKTAIETIEKNSEDPLSEFQHRLINVGLCSMSIDTINIRDQDDWKMTNKYIVEGGKTNVHLTKIGSIIKVHLQ